MTQATLSASAALTDAPPRPTLVTPEVDLAPAPATAPQLTPTELLGVAHGLAVQQNLWHPHVRHDPLQRTYHEVARTESYSAWLICWMPGHDTGFHDHDGAGGVGLVLRGEIVESRLHMAQGTIERTCGRGQHFAFAGQDIHRVHHPGGDPAVTLHVYSPVLLRMGSYEIAPDGSLRRHTLDESQELRPRDEA